MTLYIILYLVVMNLLGLLYMWADKHKAKHNQYRISQRTLFTIAWLGGSLGVFSGLRLFKHKTRQRIFKYGVPFIFIMTYGVIPAIICSYLQAYN